MIPKPAHADAATIRLLVELRDEIASLAQGEECDHESGICWCQTLDLVDRATARIKEVHDAPRAAA